jgi:ubiquinone/menaquinone biosynthesis C-methylase UbiE
MINEPVFCITSDLDWASPYCVADFINLVQNFEITPTLFATHDSRVVREFNERRPDDVNIHPNFRSDSTHGKDLISVIDHMFKLYPNARAFRSHAFYDGTDILEEMSRRGVKYDSNLCLYLQPNIVPLRLGVQGITRLPVFWEDDIHWLRTGGDWNLDKFVDAFMSPGLKIINVHPFMVSANIPSKEYYSDIKAHITTLSQEESRTIRHNGPGVRTFLVDLINFVKSQNRRFYTLHELYRMFPVESFLVSEDETKGRTTVHSDEGYQKYWGMSEAQRQDFLKDSYRQRNAKDKYATSRDSHARELEIQAIAKSIDDKEDRKGTILDLACGNGYTLISLAKRLKDWRMIGVDFSDNLIAGAKYILEEERDELQSQPEFVCADAIEYVRNLKDDSIGFVITERFVQNLPSIEWQKDLVREVYRILKTGGRFLMCEGSQDGFTNLNAIRERVGLSVIPDTSADNVSAIRIVDDEFENYAQSEVGFKVIQKLGMSNYFIISRVLHPLMVAPSRPRFDSKFNELARFIQENSEFTPGYGSNVLWVLEK